MMTIKHIDLSGKEFVYPTTHINFVPGDRNGTTTTSPIVWRYDEEGCAHEIDNGTVYVMNEHGRTVARYNLTVVLPYDGDD